MSGLKLTSKEGVAYNCYIKYKEIMLCTNWIQRQVIYLTINKLRNSTKKDIQEGVLAVGDRVDSEMEIQEMYDVSRITARQAILN